MASATEKEVWVESKRRHSQKFCNRYADLGGGIMQITLQRGLIGIFDADNFEAFKAFHWTAYTSRGSRTYYIGSFMRRRARTIVIMHRLAISAPDNMVVDHWDHNGLNNCRSNLRICTLSQNQGNRVSSRKFKGVYKYEKNRGYWSKIVKEGKNFHLGTFPTEEDAARAYDTKAVELFGEFAHTNFPA